MGAQAERPRFALFFVSALSLWTMEQGRRRQGRGGVERVRENSEPKAARAARIFKNPERCVTA